MAEENTSSPTQDPPIYKHLNPKTVGLLRQVNKSIAAKEKAAAMSNEQT